MSFPQHIPLLLMENGGEVNAGDFMRKVTKESGPETELNNTKR